jgi:hypothetical protein
MSKAKMHHRMHTRPPHNRTPPCGEDVPQSSMTAVERDVDCPDCRAWMAKVGMVMTREEGAK